MKGEARRRNRPGEEEGTLAKWLVKEGDTVASGDILAEIETDKATMEFEAVDEGTIAKILVADGTDDVKVGTIIALMAGEGEDTESVTKAAGKPASDPKAEAPATEPVARDGGETGAGQPARDDSSAAPPKADPVPARSETAPPRQDSGERVKASPLARRLAQARGIELSGLTGSGPGGRIVKADIEAAPGQTPASQTQATDSGPERRETAAGAAAPKVTDDIPHEVIKLSNMRKTIARRLTEAKQTIPHIYLTVDIRLDPLLKLRSELNKGLEGRNIRLSVNDMLIKALAASLIEVPECNVSISGDQLLKYARADISVAVSIPNGLITPIITDADSRSLSSISKDMSELAELAREGKLQPHQYQGGTASISNMGMYGIKQFDAVINPPQGMIMAIGAGEKRPYVIDESLQVATVMSATGSFDHRAIDGADGARMMKIFKQLVENPLGMLA